MGIPIFHTLKPTDKLNDLLGTFRSVCHLVRDKHMGLILSCTPSWPLLCPAGTMYLQAYWQTRIGCATCKCTDVCSTDMHLIMEDYNGKLHKIQQRLRSMAKQ